MLVQYVRRYTLFAIAFSSAIVVSMHAQTKYVYVTNETTSNISVYSVDATTGQLYSAGTVATASRPHWIQFSPSGAFAYVVSDDGTTANLTIYAVTSATGGLTQVNTVALNPGTFPTLKLSPSGSYLVLTDGRNDQVNTYSLNQTTGAATLSSTSASLNIPWSVAFGSNQYAYVVGNGNQLTIIPMSLTSTSTTTATSLSVRSSAASPGSKVPVAQMAIAHPNGRVLYVTDPIGGTLSPFSINSAGSLTALGSPVEMGVSSSDSVIDPTGKFLYTGDWRTGRIAGFSLDSNGVPTALAGSPFATRLITTSQRGGGIALAISSSGQFLYATSSDTNQITGFTIDRSSGALSPISGLLLPTGGHPFRVVAAP